MGYQFLYFLEKKHMNALILPQLCFVMQKNRFFARRTAASLFNLNWYWFVRSNQWTGSHFVIININLLCILKISSIKEDTSFQCNLKPFHIVFRRSFWVFYKNPTIMFLRQLIAVKNTINGTKWAALGFCSI